MGKVDVKVDTREVEGAILKIGERAANFDNRLMTALLLEYVEDVYDSEGSKGADGRWDPLKASTIKRRPSAASGQMLFDKGGLNKWQSATEGDTSIVWSPASYARLHARGTKNMAKRNPFAIVVERFMRDAELLLATEIVG